MKVKKAKSIAKTKTVSVHSIGCPVIVRRPTSSCTDCGDSNCGYCDDCGLGKCRCTC